MISVVNVRVVDDLRARFGLAERTEKLRTQGGTQRVWRVDPDHVSTFEMFVKGSGTEVTALVDPERC